MCKEMPVIPVDKVVDPERTTGEKWRAKQEERHKGVADQKNDTRCRGSNPGSFNFIYFLISQHFTAQP
jgi:hypothetical protein